VVFPCFISTNDAVLYARIIAKMDCSFTPFTQFWTCSEASDPHFSALDTPKLHLCTLVPMPGTPFLIPQTAFWDIPNGQMGVFYNTSCCHSYGCFTPLKRVFLPSHSVEIGHKTHVYAPVQNRPPFDKTHIRCREP
jgi:hypothetical protein